MNISLLFTRIFFGILCVIFFTTHMIADAAGFTWIHCLLGILLGIAFTALLIGTDCVFRRFNLRSFNIAVIGIFIGYLMGQGLVFVFKAILDMSSIGMYLPSKYLEMIKIALFLFGLYLGTIFTLRSSDEFYISLPFVKFSPTLQKKKDLILDPSVLADPRILDLCATGFLDHKIVVPQFLVKELYLQMETESESVQTKVRRCLEVVKKMEALPDLELRYNDTDFPEIREIPNKLIRLARLLDSNILTADITTVTPPTIEGIKVINLHALSNALKPLMQTGEILKIKVQRYGKEAQQGVGYLDDGTMVVINGGGDFIGETIEAQVLSVKHTSSGRMIFCNAVDNLNNNYHYDT